MYKVILFNHGETAANGRVLLDTSSGENPGLTQAVVETKLNEAGSFSYAIVPTHPLYEMTSPLKVYVVVEEDGTEIFYGRIISVQINPLTKIKAVTCEGALAFLLDCELPKDSDDRESTAANYFTYCINKYNEGIRNDPNRLLKVGTIDVDKASEKHTYKNGSYSQVQSTMKSQLLDVHDGFFRVRKDSGTGEHYIDWVKQVGQTNPQRIAITHNVISQNSTESGEDIFSLMRPLGNDDITISDSGGLLTVSQNMLDDYGAIIRSVNFDADSASSLKTKALEYIEKIKNRLTITGDISFVDLHFLDGSSTKVRVGDVFTNIEGYDGVKLTAESVTRNLLDAGKDKLSIKNDKELMKSAAASGANSSRSTGTTSGGRASRNSAMMYKFYHETNTDARIQAQNIALEADKKIELKAQEVTAHADQIDLQLSDKIGKVKINTDTLKEEWTLYKGTEIYLNQDHIDQVCGLYKVVETKDPRTGEVTDRKLIVKEGTGLYQTRDGVELGVYDNGNLTGGVMAQKINGQTETLIKGDLVNIGDTNSKVKLSDKITVVDGGTLIKGLVMFKASDSATNSVSINNGKVTAETVQPTTLTFHGTGGEDDYVNLGYATVANMLTNAEVDTANNLLKIWKIGDAANNPSITFSKAVTLSVEYGGDAETDTATFTVTGTPAKNFPSGNTAVGTFTVHQNKLAAYILDGTGTLRARIDNPQYSNGWSAAYGKVDLPTTSSTATSFTIETPPSTVDGNADSTTYTMNNAQKNVATVTNPSGTVVARLEHNRYNDGWDGCVATKTWVGDASKTLSYGEAVSVSASIQDKNKNPVSIGAATYVAPDYATPYNAGGATAWMDYTFHAQDDGKDISKWPNATGTGHMGYDQQMCIRYTKADGTYDWVPVYWKTPPDASAGVYVSGFEGRDIGSAQESNGNTLYAKLSNGGSGSTSIYLNSGSWSSGKIGVAARLGSSSGTPIDRVYIYAPSVTGIRAVKSGNKQIIYGKVGGSSEKQLATIDIP